MSSEECSLFQKVLGILKKLADDKLLQLPIESLFTKGLVKLLDILNVDYRESHSESDMKEKIRDIQREETISITQLFSVLKFSKATKIKVLQLKTLS